MDFISFIPYHILTVGTCGLFLCALCYFLYQILNLYFNRKIVVECWFCRSPSTVRAPDRNAFYCVSCKQYNGFTESGDYNRPLPAQYDASLNPRSFALPCNSNANNSKSNILCGLCAQRQAYKIDQLARFEPSNETDWDRELNQFKKELEGRCGLCPSCTIKVHRRINQIDAKILPRVLSWWRNRDHRDPIVDLLPYERLQGSSIIPTLLYIILSVVRITTTLVWLTFGIPPLLEFLQYHVCHSHSSSSIKHLFRNVASHLAQHYCGSIFALLDFIFMVLAADLCITCQGSDLIPALLLAALFVVAGIGVFFYNWLSYSKGGDREQNRKLNARPSPASSPSKPFSYDAASVVSSRPSKSNASWAHSLSLDRLSLHTPSSPTAYPAIFSPPTLACSPLRSHIYTSDSAPGYTHLRRGGGDGNDIDGAMSHFTSVSQCSAGWGRQSKRQHRKRRQQQPVGLLRWVVHFLFGRLEKWKDVKAELVCLLNAVLVVILLILICHLFYSIVPPLWSMRL
ncbi:hypothetical protein TcWFU_007600 [Taenia crassiceps]|uniref:Ima1 N-terminal domain-containing protein n=1 Tax=Taenia crassiceps TaxID=6207 RepID=A0ABR4QM00_9CEST